MAHNVKMSDLIKGLVDEAKSAFFEGLIEGLQSALNEMQTVAREPINAPMVAPKQKTGFLIEVAVVGTKEHFKALADTLAGSVGNSFLHKFVYKQHEFTRADIDQYKGFDKVLFIAPYLSPEFDAMIERVINNSKKAVLMTPMELINLINQPG